MACLYEYNGEWITEDQLKAQFANQDTISSKASPETISKVKEFLSRIGVEVKTLDSKYSGVNGIAKLLEGVIQVANGKEASTLTEEAFHFAVDIIKTTNPSLFKSLLNKIGSYDLYKRTLATYSQEKTYQNPDGSPNILKLKEEAIGKVLAEYFINREEGKTDKPELLQQTHNWWEQIKQWVLSLINKAQYNPFEEVISKVKDNTLGASNSAKSMVDKIDLSAIKGPLSSVIQDYAKEGNYKDIIQFVKEQLEDSNSYEPTIRTILSGNKSLAKEILNSDFLSKTSNKAVDDIYNKFKEEDKKTILVNQGQEDRHYTYNGERVANTVTSKIDDGSKFGERTELESFLDDQKRDWGSKGHEFAEAFIGNLIDEDGFKRDVPLDTYIGSSLPQGIQDKMKVYFTELINSYPSGTRFSVESKVVNTKEKGMLASTVDFLAFSPNEKTGVKVDILDWKFFNINKSKTQDIPWYKSDKWKKQMGEYVSIAKLYGLKSDQLGKTRMVPFIVNSSLIDKNNIKLGSKPISIEIGNINTAKETKLYLLPVPTQDESTGVPEVDKLIKRLQAQYQKIWKTPIDEKSRQSKENQLNELSSAIRRLHLQMNFHPLSKEAVSFGLNATKVINKFNNIDFTNLKVEEINLQLKELLELKKSSENYIGIDQVFLAANERDTLSPEQKAVLGDFEKLSQKFGRLQDEIQAIENRAAASLAIIQSTLSTKDVKEAEEKLLTPELELSMLSKAFLEGSRLTNKVIRLASNIWINRKSKQYQEERALSEEFGRLLPSYLDATKGYAKPEDAIMDKSKSTPRLIRKINKGFYIQREEARDAKNKKFFLDNMNKDKYDELAKAHIEQESKNIEDRVYSADEEENDKEIGKRIKKLKESILIDSKDFNGWYSYDFKYIFNQSINEDKNLSEDYKRIASNPAILAVWNFYTSLNQRGRDSGYIDRQGMSFLPLIQGTYLERIANSNNIAKTTAQYIKDGFLINVNENLSHARIDPETGKVIKQIPKLFTKTNKAIEDLSTDITKITAPWIHALLSYETAREVENVMLTLYDVEKSKGHLQKDKTTNQVIFEDSEPKEFDGNDKNAELLEKIVNDEIYGISEDSNTLVDIATNKLSKGTEEEKRTTKIQGKKAIQGLNTWTRMLATGGKLMVSLPNFFGGHVQAFINSGTFYRGGEYEKNIDLLCATLGKNFSLIDKGLIDLIHPLNEDAVVENTRNLSRKQSTRKYLSTWSINDIMQSGNRLGDMVLELANAKTFNDNSMVVDGKIVNIRQYLSKQDASKYTLPEAERRAITKSFESRVRQLKETKSLPKISSFNSEGVLEIPGVSKEEQAVYRTKVAEYARSISGIQSRDNKADYNRSAIFKSFMMFKNWIPKQIELRVLDINKNNELDTWEYGRTRLFVKVWSHLGFKVIGGMRDIIAGNDNGLRIMNEILQEKREAYYKATGQQLEITEAEFYDMMKKELHSQSKELVLLLGVLSLVVASKLIPPRDKKDLLAQNHLKWLQKMISKMADEVRFYYDPRSADSITKGSIIPSLSILNKVSKFIGQVEEETRGKILGDQKLIDHTHPTKYFLNLVPGAAQLQNEILPYVDPEMAKNLGIITTSQARQGN